MAGETILYDIGYKVGNAIRQSLGQKQQKEVILDVNNGSDTADGLLEPTSNYLKALSTAIKFYEVQLTIKTVNGALIHTDILPVRNQLYLEVVNSTDGSNVQISFYQLDSTTIAKFWIENSYVVFKDIEFILPKDIVGDTTFNILLTPFVLINSTVLFYNCQFTYDNMSPTIGFVAGNNSTVVLDNCRFNGQQYVFMYGINKLPNLLITNNITTDNFESDLIILQDKESNWISYSTLV